MNNSLRGSLSESDTIDQIKLSLKSNLGKNKVYILVEGINDVKLYPKFFNEMNVSVECSNNKYQLLAALDELKKTSNQVIGICDADFDHLQNTAPLISNLFYTDYHDIEMTMLSINGVLSDALTEFELQKYAPTILQKALDKAKVIGYIRWINQIEILKLNFDGLRIGRFIKTQDDNTLLNVDDYLYALNKRSSNKKRPLNSTDISQFTQSHKNADLFNLCNGHDVTALIALIIGKDTSHEKFCSVLRASFNTQYFNKSKLYIDIYNWQAGYGYSILR